MKDLKVDKKKTAFLFMDFQNFILNHFISSVMAAQVTAKAAEALSLARRAGIFIIHVNVAFRHAYPEINTHNKMFSLIREHHLGMLGSPEVQINPCLAPQDDEPVVYKRRVSAFHGTDLDLILRSRKIENLFMAGVTTSNVLLSTFNQALDLDYQVTVLNDACADREQETHNFLMDHFFPKFGSVFFTDELQKMFHDIT